MTESLRLLQFTDPHLFARGDGELKGVRTRDSLQRVLEHARRHHFDVDALLLTGDLVHDDPGGYEHVRRAFAGLGRPVWCVPGNHDDVGAYHAAFGAAPFRAGGHVDTPHWRIVLLDSVVPGAAHGKLAAAELARLETALVTAGPRHVLIALHHHPVPLASRWLDAVGLVNASEFFAIADRYASVRAVIWGHVHQAFDTRRRGVRLMSTPSTCAQFRPCSEEFAVDDAPPGYRRLELRPDGSIDSEIVRVESGAETAPIVSARATARAAG